MQGDYNKEDDLPRSILQKSRTSGSTRLYSIVAVILKYFYALCHKVSRLALQPMLLLKECIG